MGKKRSSTKNFSDKKVLSAPITQFLLLRCSTPIDFLKFVLSKFPFLFNIVWRFVKIEVENICQGYDLTAERKEQKHGIK